MRAEAQRGLFVVCLLRLFPFLPECNPPLLLLFLVTISTTTLECAAFIFSPGYQPHWCQHRSCVRPHSHLSTGINPGTVSFCKGRWETRGQWGAGRQCSSHQEQDVTSPLDCRGDIALLTLELPLPGKKPGPRLACLAGNGAAGRGSRVAASYCPVLSLVRSCQKATNRILGKWAQAHSPATEGGLQKDEQWISTKMLRTVNDPCSHPCSAPFWNLLEFS